MSSFAIGRLETRLFTGTWLLLACLAISAAVGHAVYDGSLAIFVAFSLVYFAIIVVAVLHPRDHAHLFLALMWFIGFWVKFVLHELIRWPYVEPTGNFHENPESNDAVLLVCAVGGAGYLIGRLAILPLSNRLKTRWQGEGSRVPRRYDTRRVLIWTVVLFGVVAAIALNWQFGFLVRGFVAQTPLPWPFGGLYAWSTDIGLALAISILTAWDRQTGRSPLLGFLILCVEGAAMSLSTSSRALYLFHTLPFFLSESPALASARRKLSLVAVVATWLAVGAAIPTFTSLVRLFGVSPVPMSQEQLEKATKEDFPARSPTARLNEQTKRSETSPGGVKRERSAGESQPEGGLFSRLPNMDIMKGHGISVLRILVIERWTGLEGVMSTVAYPDKSMGLLARAAFERRSYGTVDVYTRDISNSGFSERHAQRFHFASPAGPIAFLYFSGAFWVVAVGMALIAVLVTAIELLWTWLIRDPLPLAISGWYLAFIVLQLSGGVQQAIAGPLTITALFGAAHLVSARRERF